MKKSFYLTASVGSDITYDQFAFGLGQQDRLTIEESQVWHEQYRKESPQAQAEWAYEWRINYLMGNLGVDSKTADRILSTPKGKRTSEQQKAYMRANSQFGYHIIRKAPSKSTVVKQKKVSLDHVVELFEQLSKAEQAKFMRIVG
jgi:hypothetical protein